MIEFYGTDQSAAEIRTHYIDYSRDLPAGVTVTSATATLGAAPMGGTATLTIGVIASNVVPVTVSTTSAAGQYAIDVLATLSDGEISAARLYVKVYWNTVRNGMTDIIAALRGLTDTSVNDYTVGAIRYWSDYQLQEQLDRFSSIRDYEILTPIPQYSSGSYIYKIYESGIPYWENPPVIRDSAGEVISSGYTANLLNGRVIFNADQGGLTRYISGTTYNLNAAALEVWRMKWGHYAAAYDVSTDNHNLSRSQLMQHAEKMIAHYAMLATDGIVDIERGDLNAADW